MPHNSKTPPVKMLLERPDFNNLMEVLYRFTEKDDEEVKVKSQKIINNINRYSKFYEDENGIYAEVGLFNTEASFVIGLLLQYTKNMNKHTNYFEEFLKARGKDREIEKIKN